ncbi:MAG: tRNA-dihydrouridine synthase [Eubacteriaceae bacterium]|jgi:tRNA-dihydrouridine synthase B|nr:tRNA-dihydrouridine synthase [Eubacteriaceae bacterium]
MKIPYTHQEKPIFLAPMAGYTNLPFRIIAKAMGADVVITEMISAKGLYYGDKKTKTLMQTVEGEKPVGLQIFGHEIPILTHVVQKELNKTTFDFIDFNAGCPAPKIVKNNEGAALMKNPQLLCEILQALVDVSEKPVSVKMRIGWEQGSITLLPIVEKLQKIKLASICIHGRSRDAFYSGTANWDIIQEAVALSEIPIVLNGDITTGPLAAKAFEETGCAGIMVGRGAIGYPFIFQEIKDNLSGKTPRRISPKQRLETAMTHARLIDLLDYPEGAVKEMRRHLVAYTKSLPHSTTLRQALFDTQTSDDIEKTLKAYASDVLGLTLEIQKDWINQYRSI